MERAEWVHTPGNGTRYWVIAGVGEDGTPWVALPDFGKAATMEWRGYTTPGYVQEKLGLGVTDAKAISKFLTEVGQY